MISHRCLNVWAREYMYNAFAYSFIYMNLCTHVRRRACHQMSILYEQIKHTFTHRCRPCAVSPVRSQATRRQMRPRHLCSHWCHSVRYVHRPWPVTQCRYNWLHIWNCTPYTCTTTAIRPNPHRDEVFKHRLWWCIFNICGQKVPILCPFVFERM